MTAGGTGSSANEHFFKLKTLSVWDFYLWYPTFFTKYLDGL